MPEKSGKLGTDFVVRVPVKAKVTGEVKVSPSSKGPYPVDEDELRARRQDLLIVISDISTLYLTNNRTNNGSVMTLEFGRAVIGSTLPSARLGDTYGDSVSEFNETTIAESNDRILNFLDGGGG